MALRKCHSVKMRSFRQLLLTHLRHHHPNLTNVRMSIPLINDPLRDLRTPRSYSTKQNTINKVESQENNEDSSKEQSSGVVVPDPTKHLEKIELDPEVEARMKYYQQKRKGVLKMDPKDYEGTAVGQKRIVHSLLELNEGHYGPSLLKHLRFRRDEDEKYNFTDQMAFMKADIDLRWESLKRWWASIEDKDQIRLQR